MAAKKVDKLEGFDKDLFFIEDSNTDPFLSLEEVRDYLMENGYTADRAEVSHYVLKDVTKFELVTDLKEVK